MKKSTKWILGIAIGLVCVIALVAIGYLAFSWWGGYGGMMGAHGFRAWGDRGVIPWGRMPMHPYYGMPYSRFGGFYALRIVAGGLLCLGLLALIGLGLVALVRGLNRPAQPAAIAVTPAVTPPAPALVCSNCGRPVQSDWSHCPYCGNPLAEKPEGETPQT